MAVVREVEGNVLPVAEAAIIQHADKKADQKYAAEKAGKENVPKSEQTSLGKMFSFRDGMDTGLMLLGTAGGIVCGLTMPYFMLTFGKTLNGLNKDSGVSSAVRPFIVQFAYTGAVALVTGFLMVACWHLAGERQALRIKAAYVRAILRQDVGWFDEHPAGQMPTVVTAAMAKIQDGIGRKISDIVMNFAAFIGAFVVAFISNWKLSLVMLACIPFIGGSVGILTTLMGKSTIEGQGHYAKAGAVATEVFAGVRTVASLCAEPFEMLRYSNHLAAAEKSGVKQGIQKGLGQGMLFFAFFTSYALAFWYGTKLVVDDIKNDCTSNCITGGSVITSIFCVLIGGMSLGQTTPGLSALGLARGAAVEVFRTIDRTPTIDSLSDGGDKLDKVAGELQFCEVGFRYPARPDDVVYHNISLRIAPGETLALVGPSGGGKSTATKLILRFYDPTEGSLRLDGHDVAKLNVRWYRQQIGYVGQEPVLFSGTIRDNIMNGKPGCTDEDVVAAAKAANAHDYIKTFPKGYNTEVGEAGMQLSGGQKQRIAIARAIIKDPAILLLDEATSALDSHSEAVVQKALDSLRAQKKRTTITIAHRLSTIQNSDRIAVIANKGVAELGTHKELLALNGIYAELCASQAGGADEEGEVRTARQKSLSEIDAPEGEESKTMPISMTRQPSRSAMSDDRRRSSYKILEAGGVKVLEEAKEKVDIPKGMGKRLWRMTLQDWPFLLSGLGGALVTGALFPVEGVVIAQLQNNLYRTDTDKMTRTGNLWAIGFVVLALAALFGHICLAWSFAVAGERMTRALREMTFKAFLRHDIGWFDRDENGTAVLTGRLEEDASKVQNATGTNLAHKIQLFVTLVLGIVIGIISAWQIGLVAMALVPLMASAGVVQMAMLSGKYGDNEGLQGGTGAGVILGGALNGITTVTAFNMQEAVGVQYTGAIAGSIVERRKRGLISGGAFGYSQAVMFWVFAILFQYGAQLVDDGTLTFLQFFQALFSVMLGAFGVGQINADMGAAKEAEVAATRIFQVVDEPLKIDPLGEGGARPTALSGKIEFRNIKFAYPSRPDVQIYGGTADKFPRGFELTAEPGQTVALVGPSGCGKSTCISLLMRFYDPMEGQVLVDGRDTKELSVHWLRSQIGYVGQEPVLFTGSIRENIAKGKTDATKEEIEQAARAANAHDFIMAFDLGYDTDVGEKSALLSGGQKQRIAIARAIIKDPAILLLDEATSALDNTSEAVVQEALDRLQQMRRRTTLTVAHRLTTVRNSDKIAVISGGGVAELGTHDQLMAIHKGIYQGLYRQQTARFQNKH